MKKEHEMIDRGKQKRLIGMDVGQCRIRETRWLKKIPNHVSPERLKEVGQEKRGDKVWQR